MMKLVTDLTPFTYEDLIIQPQHGSVESFSDVSTWTELPDGKSIRLPIINAPMLQFGHSGFLKAMSSFALGAIPRYLKPDELTEILEDLPSLGKIFISIGIRNAKDELSHIKSVLDGREPYGLCVDVANGYIVNAIRSTVALCREAFPNAKVMVGNVASPEGLRRLAAECEADFVRLSIGSGSSCATSVATGHGYPLGNLLVECRSLAKSGELENPPLLVADGGVRSSGDILKAIALGADLVMVGRLFANVHEYKLKEKFLDDNDNETVYNVYAGMASSYVRKLAGIETRAPEGVATRHRPTVSVGDVLATIESNLKSGLLYSGAANISEFKEKAKLIYVGSSQAVKNQMFNLG